MWLNQAPWLCLGLVGLTLCISNESRSLNRKTCLKASSHDIFWWKYQPNNLVSRRWCAHWQVSLHLRHRKRSRSSLQTYCLTFVVIQFSELREECVGSFSFTFPDLLDLLISYCCLQNPWISWFLPLVSCRTQTTLHLSYSSYRPAKASQSAT